MMSEWNESSSDKIVQSEWQQYLWLKAKEISKNTLPDKTTMGQEILKALEEEEIPFLISKIPAIHIFGLSIITEFHLKILEELGKHIDVFFYLLNPAPSEYWFEDKTEKQLAVWRRKGYDVSLNNTGNPLLTSWGKLMQNTFNQLFNNEEILNSYNETGVHEPATDTMLHKIQNDIFYNKSDERNELSKEDIFDHSITINSCYTIAREVEVLYNYLVYLIDQRKEKLSPRDIVVMATDINAYAPYIKAIFDNSPYHFPITIADETFTDTDTITNALSIILEMDAENFKAEEVLQILDSSFIKKRFGITDLSLIRKVVDEANIRFGIDGKAEDDTKYVSWNYGLKRIVFGICMNGGEEYTIENDTIFPIDSLEGSDSFELIRFSHFIHVLIDAINERKNKRTLSGWVEYTEQVLQNLICEPGEEIDEDYALLMQHFESLNETNNFLDEEISFDVFKVSFLRSLSTSFRSGTFSKGGITFCSLIPMRSIPFKVVAMLGLSYDKFPRKEIQSSFNLMELKKQKGDRNVKENDKHLFLETLLSAREYLYISYIGKKPQDNAEIPPSSLVDELIDYIESGCKTDVRNSLVTQHPLHNFSKKYSRENSLFYNYRDDKMPKKHNVIHSVMNQKKETETLSFEEISLNELIRFFKNPFKEYYNKALGIRYREEELLLKETELFELENGLQQWSLKNDLLETDIDEINVLKKRYIKTGKLPLKNMADVEVNHIEQAILPVREIFNECRGNEARTNLNIEVAVDGSILKGPLTNIFGEKLIFTSLSKKESKNTIEAAILYLAAVASGNHLSVHFISYNKLAAFKGAKISQKTAIDYLTQLVKLYKKGHERMIAFYPDLEVKPEAMNELDFGTFSKIVDKAMEHGDECIQHEYRNGYFKDEQNFEEFKENVAFILKPVETIFPDYYKS
jgi:exodeoxyribonuclease V gamma subunit